ncbi:unnamed protein product [Rotaria magnacalcarata]|uniref:Uncharacterized protein n=1 Tax=Rotaria magnacalcarata TaxID=392030 RepID=A0A816TJH0_9BILA|nr:unnamed protein product [Rotaria magnacalcarata]
MIIIIIFLTIDNGRDLDVNYLTAIYERIRTDEPCSDTDHLTQVVKFEQTLIGKQSILTAPHSRLECYFSLNLLIIIHRHQVENLNVHLIAEWYHP